MTEYEAGTIIIDIDGRIYCVAPSPSGAPYVLVNLETRDRMCVPRQTVHAHTTILHRPDHV